MARGRLERIAGALLLTAACAYANSGAAGAVTAINLGAASRFAVLAASGVVNAEGSEINGDVGVIRGRIFGFPPGRFYAGKIRLDDSGVARAGEDAAAVYRQLRNLSSSPAASDIGTNLDGLELVPGVYSFYSSVRLNGTLRLDAHGKDRAVFIFQIADNFRTEPDSRVILTRPGDQVFWAVGGTATLAMRTDFRGNILARNRVDMGLGAMISCGRAFSLEAGVTMDANSVSIECVQPKVSRSLAPFLGRFSRIAPPARMVVSPEPGSFFLGCAGLTAVGAVWLARVWRSR